ncbi:hypothetical protein [Streptomyces mirabilis]|uniref:Lsr2 protein n=1 Tax=Streptomyces mirabilis TaxID=68239 RepID=A0ABU3UW91_9ACTN|nr:hypothetical protein [Streptomyces mirabilis]MDU8998205.1 hypothetical protein [Streptomyces mirabilis]
MTSQSHPSPPDPWAQSRRIAAVWAEAGRGVDRPTQVARVLAARAAKAEVLKEARLKAAVDKAVREALARPAVAEAVGRLAEAEGAAPAAPTAPAAPAVPEKPLHEMTPEEWSAHRQAYWVDRLPNQSRPMTIGELIAGQYGDGEA